MSLASAFISELDHEAATTRRVLERVPGDRLGWKPHPKSYSLGQLSLHIAQVPGAIAGLVANPVFEMSAPFVQDEAKSSAQLISELDKSLAKAKEVLGGFDDQAMMSTWSMKGGGKTIMSMPRTAVVRSVMLNHWYHHRGQLSVYLRELNVPVPAIYGPSADENPFG